MPRIAVAKVKQRLASLSLTSLIHIRTQTGTALERDSPSLGSSGRTAVLSRRQSNPFHPLHSTPLRTLLGLSQRKGDQRKQMIHFFAPFVCV